MRKLNTFTKDKLIYMIKRLDKIAQLFDKASISAEGRDKIQLSQNAMLIRASRNILVTEQDMILEQAEFINQAVTDAEGLLKKAFYL